MTLHLKLPTAVVDFRQCAGFIGLTKSNTPVEGNTLVSLRGRVCMLPHSQQTPCGVCFTVVTVQPAAVEKEEKRGKSLSSKSGRPPGSYTSRWSGAATSHGLHSVRPWVESYARPPPLTFLASARQRVTDQSFRSSSTSCMHSNPYPTFRVAYEPVRSPVGTTFLRSHDPRDAPKQAGDWGQGTL